MPLEVPKLNDLTYQALLQEVLDRVKVHNPEWTNLSESDPGVTLLELFAFLTDRLLSRANQVPERNRRAFLSLLGIPVRPAVPAQALVTFTNDRGPLRPLVLPANMEVQAGAQPFRTTAGLEILPVEARVFYKARATGVTEDEAAVHARIWGLSDPNQLQFYQTTEMQPTLDGKAPEMLDLQRDTADDSVWIALLARPQDDLEKARTTLGDTELTIGFLPVMPDQRWLPARDWLPSQAERQVPLAFEVATGRWDPETGGPVYQRVTATMSTNVLQEPGTATLRMPPAASLRPWRVNDPRAVGADDLPPALGDPKLEARLITFVRVHLLDSQFTSGVTAQLAWVGINAAPVVQQAAVEMELVGTGTGEPDQSFRLVHTSILPDTITLRVGTEIWQRTDDLATAPAEVTRAGALGRPGQGSSAANLFALDPESGVITFGNGLRGARPPRDAQIRAAYAYGGGKDGNVPAGAINSAPALPPGVRVTNPGPAWGGMNAERIADAERGIAAALKHRDRLVTMEDFQEIVRRTPGVDIGRVEVLPRFHPDFAGRVVPGAVTVLAMPAIPLDDDARPDPDPLFLVLIAQYLEPRRLITTELFVRGPEFVPLRVSIGIEVAQGYAFPTVREAVNKAIRRYLSPLHGGREGTGWALSRWVTAKELFGIVAHVDGVAYVVDLRLAGPDGPQEAVALSGLQLPWLDQIETQHGAPIPVEKAVAQPPTARKLIPVTAPTPP